MQTVQVPVQREVIRVEGEGLGDQPVEQGQPVQQGQPVHVQPVQQGQQQYTDQQQGQVTHERYRGVQPGEGNPSVEPGRDRDLGDRLRDPDNDGRREI